MRAGQLRHRVNVMRPTLVKDEYGQTQGKPKTLIEKVPCSIEPLGGRELELARATFGLVSYKVSMYGDPKKPLQKRDYLDWNGRTLEIADIKDMRMNGEELELLCGEER